MKPVIFSVLALFAASVNAECPGGCSGNGVCGRFDMCTCYKNFMGNDCSLKICPFGNAHVLTPKGDLNMDRDPQTVGTVLAPFILEKSQMYPAGTYEWNHPDAADQEAHFYMECSNEGLCDRATGLCQCFEGFEGSACQRATCNNACSEHGVCKSMREIAARADRSTSLTGNPVDAVSTVYNLWDADINHGCICDPWFTGADCSRRTCKVGVDPLYTTYGYPVYESFFLTVATVPQDGALGASSYVRLRVFDYYGESYITDRIPVFDSVVDAKDAGESVEKALLALPNGVFTDVQCIENSVEVKPLTGDVGFFVQCIYVDNPGQQRHPEIFDYVLVDGSGDKDVAADRVFVTASNRRGEDVDYAATATSFTFASTTDGITINVNNPEGATISDEISARSIVKIRDRHLLVTASASSSSANTITLAYEYVASHAGLIKSAPSLADGDVIFAAKGYTVTAVSGVTIDYWKVGSNIVTISAAITDSTKLAVGDMIFYQNAYFYVRAIDIATPSLTVDRNFGGTSADGSSVGTFDATTGAPTTPAHDTLYKVTVNAAGASYQYVSPCSGRGLCNDETGVCSCFKGYTNDNCDTQNILAF